MKAKSILKYIKLLLLIIIIGLAILTGAVGGAVVDIMGKSPEIDLSKVGEKLTENSTIIDQQGNLIEQIETNQFREVVSIDDLPKYVKYAFVAVEDERFYEHKGIDPIGIVKSALDNILAGGLVRGGSTITQQLARDLYLNDEKTLDRKIKEAYLAMKMSESLTKDEVLGIYLNRVFLGQNAYGIQAAAQTYFSKDAKDLTIAEAASLATIPKAPTDFALYNSIKPQDVKENSINLGEVNLGGEKYVAVYNPYYEDRKDYVLYKMKELGIISAEEYESAKNENIQAAIKPPQRKNNDVSTYFTSVVKAQVVRLLMDKFKLSEEQAYDKLYSGGLTITATIDFNLQKKVEDVYNNFNEYVSTDASGGDLNFINLEKDEAGNIVDSNKNILYYSYDQIFNENGDICFREGEFEINDKGLNIKTKKASSVENSIIIKPYYKVNENGDLVTYSQTNIGLDKDVISKSETGINISKKYLDGHNGFYYQGEGNIAIPSSYYTLDKNGSIQPQSSSVVIDQTTGQIKAIVGGREQKGQSIFNRAFSSVRQPGSTMKPIAVYLPALDNGYTLASVIDDVPHYNDKHELWPINWYNEYRGLMTIRKSIEVSANVNAVKMLEKVGISTSKKYLAKLGIINEDHPERDNYISKEEEAYTNDENTAAMALGGMTYGLTNVDLTAAYAAIANKGTYVEPLSFSKIVDSRDNVIFDSDPVKREVVDEEVAFLIQDALHTTTESGVAANAKIEGYDVAGKTGTSGTTTENQDSWFVGFTPYYTWGVWIGADNPQIKLKEVSIYATKLWHAIGQNILSGLPSKTFDKPSGIKKMEVSRYSGMLPTEASYNAPNTGVIEEYFTSTNYPKEEDDVLVWRAVDVNDGLLATNSTPENQMATKVFIDHRPEEYKPEDNKGIIPTDWYLMAPTVYSTAKYPTPEEIEAEKKRLEDEKKKKDKNKTDDNESPGDILPPSDDGH